ncbi:hypothetical protein SAMN05421678_109194 [Actinopolymorpha cephalotaxi]|uniref:Uncharacterized protein n=1 Tax=Actinopolymorpha cephalotaxi TaxID=504797 RepID=A0A1I2VIN8_9ACTN|nr:hypothetical protein [Actinopolymorpha cephalotaxi]SFG89042.1 hypothetical protein SAMN05421678_109194 [Actinopolymorpha cephalotaxi]
MGTNRDSVRWPGRAGAADRSARHCAPPWVPRPPGPLWLPRLSCPACPSCPLCRGGPLCPARTPRGRPPRPGRLGAGRVTAPAVRTDSTGKSRVRCRGIVGRAVSPPEADMTPPSARGRYTTGQLWESPGLWRRCPRSQETRRWSPGGSCARWCRRPGHAAGATEFAGSLGDRTPKEIEYFIISRQFWPETRVPAEQFCALAGSHTAICSVAELRRRYVDISEPTRSHTEFRSTPSLLSDRLSTGRSTRLVTGLSAGLPDGFPGGLPGGFRRDKAAHSCRSDRRREMRVWSSLRCGFTGRRLDGRGDDAGS